VLLLVGLGNPGPEHAGNRHNIGFMAVGAIAARFGFPPARRRFHGLMTEGSIEGKRVALLCPTTYMNESGRSVGEAMRYFHLGPAEVLVFHDEIELLPFRVRIKTGGGNAGHNGLRSIDAHVGKDYRRVRLGVGRPEDRDQVANFVLRDFAKAERDDLAAFIDAIAEFLPRVLEGDEAGFMNKVTLRLNPPKKKEPPAKAATPPD